MNDHMGDRAAARAPQRATIEDLVTVAEEPHEFWGERDLPALHHPLLVHEFGETALVIHDDGGGRVIAYLCGYIHLVAVREGHRRAGLARALYERFEAIVRERDAVALKAFTQPSNTRSIAFHRSLGFSATDTSDYAGPGETRTVFWKDLSEGVRPAATAPGLSN
jgi:GNAT superfamily N-acetyltransferase